jgi:hypothetical protein
MIPELACGRKNWRLMAEKKPGGERLVEIHADLKSLSYYTGCMSELAAEASTERDVTTNDCIQGSNCLTFRV